VGEQRWCPGKRAVVQDIVAAPVVESAGSPEGPLGTGRGLECPKGDATPDSWTDGGFWEGET